MLVWMMLEELENPDEAEILGQIYTAYAARVYKYLRRNFPKLSDADIEDAVSETFLVMIQKKDRFIKFGEKTRINRLIVYARCQGINLCRKYKTDAQFLIDWSLFGDALSEFMTVEDIPSDINIEEEYVSKEFDRLLCQHAQTLLKKLPSPAYEIMMLKIEQECSSFDIGKLLQMHPGTVRTIFRRTCKKIKSEMDELYGNQ